MDHYVDGHKVALGPDYIHGDQLLIKVVAMDPVSFTHGASEYHILP